MRYEDAVKKDGAKKINLRQSNIQISSSEFFFKNRFDILSQICFQRIIKN